MPWNKNLTRNSRTSKRKHRQKLNSRKSNTHIVELGFKVPAERAKYVVTLEVMITNPIYVIQHAPKEVIDALEFLILIVKEYDESRSITQSIKKSLSKLLTKEELLSLMDEK